MLLDDADSHLIPYQIGDVFISHSLEETQEMLEEAKVCLELLDCAVCVLGTAMGWSVQPLELSQSKIDVGLRIWVTPKSLQPLFGPAINPAARPGNELEKGQLFVGSVLLTNLALFVVQNWLIFISFLFQRSLQEEIEALESRVESIQRVLSDLKVQLYAKFGNNINLEAEDS